MAGDDVRWELPFGWRAAFSGIADGDPREPGPRSVLLARLGWSGPMAVPQQVHGTRIVPARPGWQADCDGLVLSEPGLAGLVFGADCPGLVLVAPEGCCLAHCGWRGTAGGIVSAAIAALSQCSEHPRSAWTALIGPGVHPEDYEVDAPVLGARVWPTLALRPTRPGHAQLDLPRSIAADCLASGVGTVITSPVSTSRDPRLWSYRIRGAGLVQALVVWRKQAGS